VVKIFQTKLNLQAVELFGSKDMGRTRLLLRAVEKRFIYGKLLSLNLEAICFYPFPYVPISAYLGPGSR